MFKKIVFAIMLFLLTPIVLAGNTEDNYFFDRNSGNPVTGVDMLIYQCTDNNEQCVTVRQPAVVDVNSGNDAFILGVELPTTVNPIDYAKYFFADGYLPLGYVLMNNYGSGEHYVYNRQFEKIPVCHAPVENLNIINTVYQNEPLQINVTAMLGSKTYSAFKSVDNPPYYIPEDYKEEYFSAETLLVLEIYGPDGSLVFTGRKNVNIYMDTSVDTLFNWVPQQQGQHTVLLRTDVTDNQCEASDPESTQAVITVLPERPRNMCVAILNDLASDNPAPMVNDLVTFSYSKISYYADDNSEKTAIPLDIEYFIKEGKIGEQGTVVEDGTALLNETDVNLPVAFDFSWQPDTDGWYTVTVLGQSNSPLCNSLQSLTDERSLEIFVAPIPRYDLIFTINDKESADAIEDAQINVNGAVQLTGVDGVAVFEDNLAGLYCYEITAPGYEPLSSCVTLQDRDLYIYHTLDRENVGPRIYLDDIDPYNIDENTASSFDLDDYISDDDNADSELIVDCGLDANVQIDIDADHIVTLTPVLDWTGTTTITCNVEDPDGLQDSDDLTIIINPVNDAPTLSNLPDIEIDEDNVLMDAFNLRDYAEDSETADEDLIYAVEANDCGISIDDNDNVDIQPPLNYFGDCIVKITVSDGDLEASKFLSLRVIPVNDLPEFKTSPTLIAYVDILYIYHAEVSDVDNNASFVVFSLEQAPSGMVVDVSGVVSWTPAMDQVGNHQVVLNAEDSEGGVAVQEFTINVLPSPDYVEPTADAGGPYQCSLGQTINLTGSVSDGIAPYTYKWDLDGDGSIDSEEQNPTFECSTVGLYIVSLEVTDLAGFSDEDSAEVDVAGDSVSPVIIINSPEPVEYNTTTVHVDVLVEDNLGVDHVWFDVGGQAYDYVGPVDLVLDDNTAYTLTVYANDTSGNLVSESVDFSVDTGNGGDVTAPVITIISPEPIAYQTSRVDVELEVIDDVAVDDVWLEVEGQYYDYVPGGIALEFLGDGEHTLTAYANDTSGNIATESVTFSTTTIPVPPEPVEPGKDPAPLYKKQSLVSKEIFVNSINMVGAYDVMPGDVLRSAVTFENTGSKTVRDATVSVSIPELGVRRKVGPFNLNPNKMVTKYVDLYIPYAEQGIYDIKFSIGNDKVKRTIYREVVITD